MNIKEIAPKLTQKLAIAINDDEAVEFAEALISAYKAELLKEVGEPVGWTPKKFFARTFTSTPPYTDLLSEYDEVVTSDQVAAAILKATKPLEDQLATAEQRVAEACALQVATETKFHWLDAARVAKEIRSGEWRKFVKEG